MPPPGPLRPTAPGQAGFCQVVHRRHGTRTGAFRNSPCQEFWVLALFPICQVIGPVTVATSIGQSYIERVHGRKGPENATTCAPTLFSTLWKSPVAEAHPSWMVDALSARLTQSRCPLDSARLVRGRWKPNSGRSTHGTKRRIASLLRGRMSWVLFRYHFRDRRCQQR